MKRNKVMVIAEAGVNHNGKLELALKLCDSAKEAGADVVKFQTWKTENIITRHVEQASYQVKNTGKKETQFEMLKRLELSFEDFKKIKLYCDKIGLIFSSTADDIESLDFLVNLGVPFIKVSSGDIGNVSYLRYIGSKNIPVIISTGMSSLFDVKLSISALREGGATDITVLHCTTNYPCPYEEVNLNAMNTLRNGLCLPVGYSDHTIGCEIPWAAISMGACVIEKHFTLDRDMEGPDQIASTDPIEFKRMIKGIRNIEAAMGDGRKEPTISEKEIAKVVTKRIVARVMIQKGSIITEKMIAVKRNDIGALASEWDMVIGREAKKEYQIDEGIKI